MEVVIMFPPLIRMSLIALGIIIAVASFLQGKETWPLYLIAAFFLVYEHIRGGSIWIAFQAYRKQKIEKVRKYIASTKKPEWLRPSSRAYYHFLSGVVYTADEDYKRAKESFLLAAKGNLRADHTKCFTYCILADTSLRLNEPEEAKKYFEIAKKIPHSDEIKTVFDELTKRIYEKA